MAQGLNMTSVQHQPARKGTGLTPYFSELGSRLLSTKFRKLGGRREWGEEPQEGKRVDWKRKAQPSFTAGRNGDKHHAHSGAGKRFGAASKLRTYRRKRGAKTRGREVNGDISEQLLKHVLRQ